MVLLRRQGGYCLPILRQAMRVLLPDDRRTCFCCFPAPWSQPQDQPSAIQRVLVLRDAGQLRDPRSSPQVAGQDKVGEDGRWQAGTVMWCMVPQMGPGYYPGCGPEVVPVLK